MRYFLLKAALFSFLYFISPKCLFAQSAKVLPGAYQIEAYLPLLNHHKVGLVINQSSEINQTLLLDTLLKKQINVVKIFVPEHGFRGTADAGATIKNGKDSDTQIPIVSLYGKNKKPSKEQLSDIDILVYDLQDVGVRFYTYISTLEYLMQACIENNKHLILLDRPNPNAHIVDGPILDTTFRSFVGMQPIPILYGMTQAEYAKMLCGEKWIENAAQLQLTIIACKNYSHSTPYQLPIAPSPNLKDNSAIYLYPSLCFFEGTPISVGRGTTQPFRQWGHPLFKKYSSYFFTPQALIGASKPLYAHQACYGKKINGSEEQIYKLCAQGINLDYLIQAYKWYPYKDRFFNPFFEKLAGTALLRKQIQNGLSARAIKASWQKDLEHFKQIRSKYLIYPD